MNEYDMTQQKFKSISFKVNIFGWYLIIFTWEKVKVSQFIWTNSGGLTEFLGRRKALVERQT